WPAPPWWPMADWGPCETMNSSLEQPWSMKVCAIAALSCSEVSGRPFAPRNSSAATAIPASAAFCARRTPASSCSFLTRRRSAKKSRSAESSTPSARRRSAKPTAKVCGTTAFEIPGARDIDFAGEAQKLVEGLAELGELVSTRTTGEPELGIERFPAIALLADGDDTGIRYYGLPWGYELSSLVGAVVEAGRPESSL